MPKRLVIAYTPITATLTVNPDAGTARQRGREFAAALLSSGLAEFLSLHGPYFGSKATPSTVVGANAIPGWLGGRTMDGQTGNDFRAAAAFIVGMIEAGMTCHDGREIYSLTLPSHFDLSMGFTRRLPDHEPDRDLIPDNVRAVWGTRYKTGQGLYGGESGQGGPGPYPTTPELHEARWILALQKSDPDAWLWDYYEAPVVEGRVQQRVAQGVGNALAKYRTTSVTPAQIAALVAKAQA
jgi:hypothetical protein